jgi:uncharacterized protein (TIGR02217 family)
LIDINPESAMASPFHDVRFPLDIARGARGGPERRTEVVTLASGREQRNARWAGSRRRWDAGYGVKSVAGLAAVVAFFEERRGRLTGFRWRDPLDHSSAAPGATPTALDQPLGLGNAVERSFQLVKRYGGAFDPYDRPIARPVAGSVRVAVDGIEKSTPADFSVDTATGIVTFSVAATPTVGAVVTAGFEFDVPVRFDSDRLAVDLSAFEAGAIPEIPVIEILG